MPIYEYACDACGQRTEAIQKLSDAPLMECPECGQPALRKLVSAAGFRLKGSGWYETDFKGGKKRNPTDSESGKPSGDSESGKSAGGSESKSQKVTGGSTSSGSESKASSA